MNIKYNMNQDAGYDNFKVISVDLNFSVVEY